MNVLVGATGSVASIKLWALCRKMLGAGNVRVVLTERAKFFTERSNDPEYCSHSIYLDEDEWQWEHIGDTVLHIHLKDWADVLVIAPLSANTLAKMTHGICDNLLTSIYRAWPMNKPVIVAPAMNTDMWENPITAEQLEVLDNRHTSTSKITLNEHGNAPEWCYSSGNEIVEYGGLMNSEPKAVRTKRFHVVQPVSKMLACGVQGMGAMANIVDIVDAVKKYGAINAF